jgi:hypothetical protein
MSKQSQKEAVFSAVNSVISENNLTVSDGQSVSEVLNRETRAQITNILQEGFSNGSIELDKQFTSDSALRTYCSGLLSNWLRKDTRLNGGVKYRPANPGSRAGNGDPSIKAMRVLLNSGKVTSETDRSEIETLIANRLQEIGAAKSAASVTVDYDALPESLRSKYSAE